MSKVIISNKKEENNLQRVLISFYGLTLRQWWLDSYQLQVQNLWGSLQSGDLDSPCSPTPGSSSCSDSSAGTGLFPHSLECWHSFLSFAGAAGFPSVNKLIPNIFICIPVTSHWMIRPLYLIGSLFFCFFSLVEENETQNTQKQTPSPCPL